MYLSEELNIHKLSCLFNASNPTHKVSYDKFREIFNNNFNIAFGYPRKDTCSFCDLYKSKNVSLEDSLVNVSQKAKEQISNDLKKLENDHKIHLLKSEKFYKLKRAYRKARQNEDLESITMDYQKNLPTPNITTNDVYYKRQLNFISFNIHILSNQESLFYTYDESVARKGQKT